MREILLTPSQIKTTGHTLHTLSTRSDHTVSTHGADVVAAETRVEAPCTLETGRVLVEDCQLDHP